MNTRVNLFVICFMLLAICILSIHAEKSLNDESSMGNEQIVNDKRSMNLFDHLRKVKRSPFLRLDELSNRIYLAKSKLGGGLIDPFAVGKRNSYDYDAAEELAATIYDGFGACVVHEKCMRTLKFLIESQ